jgi:hypothetical protein
VGFQDKRCSLIPFPGQIRKPQKSSMFSVGCRNSEIFG